jgi:hypothetical protein
VEGERHLHTLDKPIGILVPERTQEDQRHLLLDSPQTSTFGESAGGYHGGRIGAGL